MSDLHRRSPARRSIGFDILRFPGAPDGHADGDRDGNEAAGGRDVGALDEDGRRIGVIGVPPPEEGGRQIDGHAARQLEPRLTKLRLEAEPPSRPLRRRPDRDEHDEEDDGDLAPQDLGGGQAALSSTANAIKVGWLLRQIQDAATIEPMVGGRSVQKQVSAQATRTAGKAATAPRYHSPNSVLSRSSAD